MRMSREESSKIIEQMLNGDQEAAEIFYKAYDKILWDYATKYIGSIGYVSRGLYTLQDIHGELWLHVWKSLPKFDPERAGVVSWLYLICKSKCDMIYRDLTSRKNAPNEEEGEYLSSLNDTFSDKDGDPIELIDLIMDPTEAFDNQVIAGEMLFNYIYLLKGLLEKSSYHQRVAYMHMIKGVTNRETGAILGISQSYVSRLQTRLFDKAYALWEKAQRSHVDQQKADYFSMLLLSDMTDDRLANECDLDLGVVKICREILALADIYHNAKEV